MTFDPDKIAHELRKRGDDWADKDAAYRALDDATKTILAEQMIKAGDVSAAKAEMLARASDDFKAHLFDVSQARRNSNRAKVAYDTYQAWMELKRTQAANTRAEMRL